MRPPPTADRRHAACQRFSKDSTGYQGLIATPLRHYCNDLQSVSNNTSPDRESPWVTTSTDYGCSVIASTCLRRSARFS